MNPTSIRLVPTEQDRADLVRAFTAWTGNAVIAEDLAQQTLLEAWRSDRQPQAAEWRPWLFGIARNMLLRWRRDLARDLRRSIAEPESEAVLGAIASDIDLDQVVEQREIVTLLHEVLDALSEDTRNLLLLKYIHELPQSEIADRLGLHEKAVEGRLHRGKRTLRDHLLRHKPDTALSLGLVTEPNVWQQSDIWCTHCGMRQLEARWYDDGRLRMDCPTCRNGWYRDGERSRQFSGEVSNLYVPVRPTFRKAMSELHKANDQAMVAGRDGSWPCPNCSGTVRPVALPSDSEDSPNSTRGIDLCYACGSCGAEYVWRNLPASGIYTSAGKAFELRHTRVRMRPLRSDERFGRPTMRSSWQAIDGTAEFVTWFDTETWRLIDAMATDD